MVQTVSNTNTFVRMSPLQVTHAGRNLNPTVVTVAFSPNPAQDFIDLKFEGNPKNLHLWMTDLAGRRLNTLFEGKIEANKLKIALPQLSNGLYFLNIEADGKSLPVQKISIK